MKSFSHTFNRHKTGALGYFVKKEMIPAKLLVSITNSNGTFPFEFQFTFKIYIEKRRNIYKKLYTVFHRKG